MWRLIMISLCIGSSGWMAPPGGEGGGVDELEFALIGKDLICLGGTGWMVATRGSKGPIVRPAKRLLILTVANGFRYWHLSLV